jgi:hypothetical protein
MLLLLKLLIWTVRALARSRQALLLDNLALRQQLATLVQRSGRRARLGPLDRVFWVALRALWTDWATSHDWQLSAGSRASPMGFARASPAGRHHQFFRRSGQYLLHQALISLALSLAV